MEKRIEAELPTQKFTVDDAKRMLEKLSETFADKPVGDMWSMGFLTTMRVTDILDLLNRQKAEIENKNVEIDILIRKKETLRDEISALSAEVERLEEDNKQSKLILEGIADAVHPLPFETDYDKAINQAKSEAYREFADKVKEGELYMRVYFPNTELGTEAYVVLSDDIDNLVKEMVGDSDA